MVEKSIKKHHQKAIRNGKKSLLIDMIDEGEKNRKACQEKLSHDIDTINIKVQEQIQKQAVAVATYVENLRFKISNQILDHRFTAFSMKDIIREESSVIETGKVIRKMQLPNVLLEAYEFLLKIDPEDWKNFIICKKMPKGFQFKMENYRFVYSGEKENIYVSRRGRILKIVIFYLLRELEEIQEIDELEKNDLS